MKIYKTTAEEKLLAAGYAVEMQGTGEYPNEFVANVLQLAGESQGAFDLLSMWSEAREDAHEREQIVADLQELIDDHAAPAEVTVKPKLNFDDLPAIAADILIFKKRLRNTIDKHGGVTAVARLVGIPQPSLSRMLASGAMPRRTTLYKIAAALDLSETEIATEWTQ